MKVTFTTDSPEEQKQLDVRSARDKYLTRTRGTEEIDDPIVEDIKNIEAASDAEKLED